MNRAPADSLPSATPDRDRPDAAAGRARVILVTGMSGAGKTSALKALEDLGFEAVDNLPLSLLMSLVPPGERRADNAESPGFARPLAIGIDIRTRDFGAQPFLAEMERLAGSRQVDVRILFLDCDDEELKRRYAETRHRHPLALDRPVSDGIAHERRLMAALKDRSDVAIDTTGLGPGELKRLLAGHFGTPAATGLSVVVTSFAYRRGLPREADLVFDVRFLANPHYDPTLRPMDGRNEPVGQFISRDPGYGTFIESLTRLLKPLLPRYVAEGKSYLTIAVGCTGGRHRSVFVAETLARWLEAEGEKVAVLHRDLDGGED